VRETNRKAMAIYETWNALNPQHRHEWKEVDEIEINAFIGLLILAGVMRSMNENLEELWSIESGRPIFRASMPLKRRFFS
jgi:hypothetical protein